MMFKHIQLISDPKNVNLTPKPIFLKKNHYLDKNQNGYGKIQDNT